MKSVCKTLKSYGADSSGINYRKTFVPVVKVMPYMTLVKVIELDRVAPWYQTLPAIIPPLDNIY